MDIKTQDKLEIAVMRYVDGLDIDALIQIVSEDLWNYYRNGASQQEVLEFISEMQVTDGEGV